MATVRDATTVAIADAGAAWWMILHDPAAALSSADKKVRADGFAKSDGSNGIVTWGGRTLTVPATGTAALLGTAATFTAIQIMQSGVAIGVAAGLLSRPTGGVIRQSIEGVSIAIDGTVSVATTAGRALAYVYFATVGVSALVMLDGASSALIFGSTSSFSLTADTASRINIYASGVNVIIQNKTAATAFVATHLFAY